MIKVGSYVSEFLITCPGTYPNKYSNMCIDNLRYTFDYCIFGFPNATVASTPCSTSFACGDLRESLTDDNLNPEDNGYSYCPGTGPMSDDMVSKCMSCVSASDDQDYLANCKSPHWPLWYLNTN